MIAFRLCWCLIAASLVAATVAWAHQPPAGSLRVLLITGGHDFDREGFKTLWRAMPDVSVREVAHPDAHQWFRKDPASQCDVICFYNMHQEIAEDARTDLVNVLKRGKGAIVLHHALANYQGWDEWLRIAGGRFRLGETEQGGVKRPASTWKDDVSFRVKIADKKHPVTRGLDDFDVVDETYGDFDVLPSVKPLLKTDESTSGKIIAWAHVYGRSRVVTIQGGHGPSAWQNPSFRRLLDQALRWAARRPAK